MPIFLFYGNDIKLLKKRIKEEEDKILSQYPEIEIESPENPKLESFLALLSSQSLFSNYLLLKIYEPEKINEIEKILDYESPSIFLFFISYKEKYGFKKSKNILEINCNLPKNYELEKIIAKRFLNRIDAEAISYLSKNITSIIDLDELEEEMKQNQISYLDLKTLSQIKGEGEAKIFMIIEDIFQKKINSAILQLHEFLDSGGSVQTLFFALSEKIHFFYALKKAASENNDEKYLSSIFNLHPFIIKKTLTLLNHYSFAQLEDLMLSLPKIEYAMRLYDANLSDYFIEKLILDIAIDPLNQNIF